METYKKRWTGRRETDVLLRISKSWGEFVVELLRKKLIGYLSFDEED